MSATIIPLARRARPVPPELQPVFALLAAIADEELRRYCLDQLAAARDRAELDAAFALARALADACPYACPDTRARGGEATAAHPVADIGQGPAAEGRGILARPRRRKARCIAISSSP